MKLRVTGFTLLVLLSLACIRPTLAQTVYTPVTVTGFTDDIVADGAGPAAASTTNPADQGVQDNRFDYVAPNYVSPSGATPSRSLPSSGIINSVATSGLSFQLRPYNGLNSLRLAGTSSGTLTLATPQATQNVWVAGASGNGQSTGTPVSMTVNFTDGTTQAFTNNVPDWFYGTGFAVQNLGRVNRDLDVFDNTLNEPRIYQFQLQLLSSNYGKLVRSVTFSKTQPVGATILNTFNGLAITLSSSCTLPAGSITAAATTVCPGTAVPLAMVVLGVGNGYAGQWQSSADGITWTDIVGATSPTYTATPQATTRYRYRAACGAQQGFIGPVTLNVVVPAAAVAYDNAAYCRTGRSAAPVATPVGGQFSAQAGLVLDPATGVIDLEASTAGSYNVTYTSPGLCPATATVPVLVKSDALPVFPNIITPNGDGQNEGLVLKLADVSNFSMQVYNRWGRQVWKGQDPTVGWAAKLSSPGYYFYEVNYTDCANHLQHYKGWLEVVK